MNYEDGELVWVYEAYSAEKGSYGRVAIEAGRWLVDYGGVLHAFTVQKLKRKIMPGEATHQFVLPSGGVRFFRKDLRCPCCHQTVLSVHLGTCEGFGGTVRVQHALTLLEAVQARLARWITVGGERLAVSQWAQRNGIDKDVIYDRLRLGWEESRAVSAPLGSRRLEQA